MPEKRAFEKADLDGLWKELGLGSEPYHEPAPSDDLIASIEEELGGYRLPAAYIELARIQNGGRLKRTCYPMKVPTGWSADHIAITGISAIGRTANYSLCGELGSKFWEEEWEYPPIGIYFADTPSAGHEMIALDYRGCGKRGEPCVVYLDQEDDYKITTVAPDFATFIKGLVDEDAYLPPEEDPAVLRAKIEFGTLSPIVKRALDACRLDLPDGERLVRGLAQKIVDQKGDLLLHFDEYSQLMYGLMFSLYSRLKTATSFEDFVLKDREQISYERPCYELMIVFEFTSEPFEFHTGGYAPGFIQDWWDAMVASGEIVKGSEGYRLTAAAEKRLLDKISSLVDPSVHNVP